MRGTATFLINGGRAAIAFCTGLLHSIIASADGVPLPQRFLMLFEPECRSSIVFVTISPFALCRGSLPMQSQAFTPASPPNAVVLRYARALLAGFTGTLQVDGYAGYNALADATRPGGAVTLAFCWSHFRRRFYDIAKSGNAPIAAAALDKIGELYGLEADIRGRTADERRSARMEHSKPLVDALKAWLGEQLGKASAASSMMAASRSTAPW